MYAEQAHASPIATLPGTGYFYPFALAAVMLLAIALRLNNLAPVPFRSPDEWAHTSQAKVISRDGVRGLPGLVAQFNAYRDFWIYPPPTRIGYTWPISILMRLTGRTGPELGASLSCACSILSLLLLILMGLRFFNPPITLIALLFMCASPLDLAIARRAWADSMLGLVNLACLYLSCEITRAPRRTAPYILLVLSGSIAVFIKETGPLAFGLCAAWIAVILIVREHAGRRAALLILVSILGLAIAAGILTAVCGGISQVAAVLRNFKAARNFGNYGIEYQNGPYAQFLQLFWLTSPAAVVMGFVGIVALLLGGDRTISPAAAGESNFHLARIWTVLFSVIFTAIWMLTPQGQNFRYLYVVMAALYFMAGFGVWLLLSWARARLAREPARACLVLAVILLIGAAVRDYRCFTRVFRGDLILDLSVKVLRDNWR
ncbi:MAG: hypothetical protein NT045_06530 [Candidatus Aureabacteria bacterium]|nr:hypothetical protein [Candidatus Auribacterota bacterium]